MIKLTKNSKMCHKIYNQVMKKFRLMWRIWKWWGNWKTYHIHKGKRLCSMRRRLESLTKWVTMSLWPLPWGNKSKITIVMSIFSFKNSIKTISPTISTCQSCKACLPQSAHKTASPHLNQVTQRLGKRRNLLYKKQRKSTLRQAEMGQA